MGEDFYCVVHNVFLTLQGKRLYDFAECRAYALNSGGNTDYVRPEPILRFGAFFYPNQYIVKGEIKNGKGTC